LIARYGYDPLDRRIWKKAYSSGEGRRTYYLYADEGLIAEATQPIIPNADGTATAATNPHITTQYGPRPDAEFTAGILFVKTQNSNGQDTVAYYHHDHLQTPIQATDKQGNLVWSATYEPFGQATITTPAATEDSPTITSNLRLPGQYFDDETGLHYNLSRYYDPSKGRYVTSDPIGLNAGINMFSYAYGDPLLIYDPYGLWGLADLPDIPQPVVDFSAGFGDTMSFGLTNWVRNQMGKNSFVNKCSRSYYGGNLAGIGWGLALSGAGLIRGGMRLELGNWKQGGEWFFREGTRGPHFHFGSGPGLQMHHLPWQAGNWIRNLISLAKNGKGGNDLAYIGMEVSGGGVVESGIIQRCGCD
jgi:RHS repeat-associated protein